MQFIKGQKLPLAGLGIQGAFDVVIRHTSSVVADVSVFGLDNTTKLSDERYMTFYNQPVSPCGSVRLTNKTTFCIHPETLPATITTLMVVIAIDGQGVARDLTGLTADLQQNGKTVASFTPNDLTAEKAVMLLQIYKKDVWRISAVGQGFEGGLARLIEHFGGQVADEPTASQTAQTPPSTTIDLKKKLSLEKAQKTGSASIVDLTKKSLITLEKKGLLNVKARVALVLDASGSMNWQYNNGDVQKVVDRLMPLAINFDDDGEFECWAFAQYTTELDSVTLANVSHFVNTTKGGHKAWQVGARVNEEIPAIQAVISHYVAIKDDVPTYVLFISDGGVGSSRQMQKILTECSNLPIFWQFVGIGGHNYGVLERLDIMTGRVVDNCNFFALDRIDSIDDTRLYELLLAEFPTWLDEIKRKNLLSNRTPQSTTGQTVSDFWRRFFG